MSEWVLPQNKAIPPEVQPVKEEYDELERLMESWKVPNSHQPFTKNVVCLLGTTSSGKSSFVNHFFQAGVKKVALNQQDTNYTIVETVPEDEFARLVGEGIYKRRPLSEEQISAPVQDTFSDSRRNLLYVVLDTTTTIARHQQFENFSNVFKKHDLINSVLINEYYLCGNKDSINRMKNTIVIDSPGFTAETQVGKLRGNLEILQYMYTLADLTLFFIASEAINSVSSEIMMLELSILYAFHGENHFNEALNTHLEKISSGSTFSVSHLFQAVSSSVLSAFQGSKTPVSVYNGTAYWDKVKFILSKIDQSTLRCSCRKEIRPEAQFFELGVVLGKYLRFLKPPVFDHCFAIATPEKQRYTYLAKTGSSRPSGQITTSRVVEARPVVKTPAPVPTITPEKAQLLHSQIAEQYKKQVVLVTQQYGAPEQRSLLEQYLANLKGQYEAQLKKLNNEYNNQMQIYTQQLQQYQLQLLQQQQQQQQQQHQQQVITSTNDHDDEVITGDLSRLLSAIGSLNFYDSFLVRLESAIQLMCSDLRNVVKESYNIYSRSRDLSVVDRIEKASKNRSRNRATASSQNKQ